MKKIASLIILLISSYSYACSDLLDTEMRVLDSSETVNLCKYTDKVVLVVNVASRCGYTYQYSSLQKLYEDYKDEGFIVLGVPSRDFMQEYSDESDVDQESRNVEAERASVMGDIELENPVQQPQATGQVNPAQFQALFPNDPTGAAIAMRGRRRV